MRAVPPGQRQQQVEHDRMYVQVLVAVHVRKRQASRGKTLELSRDLARQILLRSAVEGITQAQAQRIIGKPAAGIHQVRNLPGVEGGATA